MTTVDIPEDTWNKLKEFKKVVKAILEDELLENDSDYIDLVLRLGLDSMIKDILPKEEPTLIKEMVNMFGENPEFISKHIVDTLNRGKEVEQKKQLRQKWSHYQ